MSYYRCLSLIPSRILIALGLLGLLVALAPALAKEIIAPPTQDKRISIDEAPNNDELLPRVEEEIAPDIEHRAMPAPDTNYRRLLNQMQKNPHGRNYSARLKSSLENFLPGRSVDIITAAAQGISPVPANRNLDILIINPQADGGAAIPSFDDYLNDLVDRSINDEETERWGRLFPRPSDDLAFVKKQAFAHRFTSVDITPFAIDVLAKELQQHGYR